MKLTQYQASSVAHQILVPLLKKEEKERTQVKKTPGFLNKVKKAEKIIENYVKLKKQKEALSKEMEECRSQLQDVMKVRRPYHYLGDIKKRELQKDVMHTMVPSRNNGALITLIIHVIHTKSIDCSTGKELLESLAKHYKLPLKSLTLK